MSKSRLVYKVIQGKDVSDGAGVKLKRTIGGTINYLDPFLLLDEFKSDDPNDYISGFSMHPHRGFETVTYMLAGFMEHKDDKGNTGLLQPGGVQWMTAGKGIVHSEMPKQDNGLLHGFQTFINMRAQDKMTTDPGYLDIAPKEIPQLFETDGSKVRVVAGQYKDKSGPVQNILGNLTYLDVDLKPGAMFSEYIPVGYTAFIYVVKGCGIFGPVQNSVQVKMSQLAIFDSADEGRDSIQAMADDEGCRFLLMAAMPLNEPMVRYGPFVMNTELEIQQAFKDYQSGNF
ncbi:hypothetical protein CYY_002836 [Polysphondylium violaceum]|uniref:Pirin family protein n=1 Tax=Polysphondylium violaceum TaxID=133409 RepID=A0A8J4PY61_9MYCE|nr:hypothetical protein CYY_002836 [Polysphondylium violaceum]